jgi:abhydrolase domain-containing protein 14
MKSGTVAVGGRNVYYIHNDVKATPQVVFFHDKKHNAKIWQDVGTMGLLAKNGISAISINSPTHYPSHDTDLTPAAWVREVLFTMKIANVVIVSPSDSTEYTIPYMIDSPRNIKGFISVANTNLNKFVHPFARQLVPVLAIWGENDKVVDKRQGQDFILSLKNGEYKEMPDCGHNCFLQKPEEFNQVVLEFVNKIFKKA